MTVDDALTLRENGVNVVGVGYTVYLGSEYESEQMREAAQACFKAHRNGLLAVLWIYPRGTAVPKEQDPHLIAGATGLGATLGADFVKVNYPKPEDGTHAGRGVQGGGEGGGPHARDHGGRRQHRRAQVPADAARPDQHRGRLRQRHRPQHPPEAAARKPSDDERHLGHHVRRPHVDEAMAVYEGREQFSI